MQISLKSGELHMRQSCHCHRMSQLIESMLNGNESRKASKAKHSGGRCAVPKQPQQAMGKRRFVTFTKAVSYALHRVKGQSQKKCSETRSKNIDMKNRISWLQLTLSCKNYVCQEFVTKVLRFCQLFFRSYNFTWTCRCRPTEAPWRWRHQPKSSELPPVVVGLSSPTIPRSKRRKTSGQDVGSVWQLRVELRPESLSGPSKWLICRTRKPESWSGHENKCPQHHVKAQIPTIYWNINGNEFPWNLSQ